VFDEANLNEDLERGTRQKIDEPKTPYHHSYSPSHESDASASQSASCESEDEPDVPLSGAALHHLAARMEEHQQQTGNYLIWIVQH